MAIRIEHQLIIALTGEQIDRDKLTQFLFTHALDWVFFANESARHGVAPFILHVIQNGTFSDLFPPHTLNSLRSAYQETAFHHLLLFQETKTILESFIRKNIPFILLKGAALSYDVYKNIALRPASDVDLLVPKDLIKEAKATLLENGFSSSEQMIHEKFYLQNHFHLSFHKNRKNANYQIEIHWHLMDKYLLNAMNIHEIWERKRPLFFEGVQSSGLSTEDNLIYLALHALKHGFMNTYIASKPEYLECFFHPMAENKLMWFLDLKKLIELNKNELDWKLFIATADRWGVLESVRPVFILLHRLFENVKISNEMLKPNAPVKISFLKKTLIRFLIKKSSSPFIRKHFLTMKGDLQFRPIRIFDILEYLFPSFHVLSKIYQFTSPLMALYYYPYHFIKTVSLSIYGLGQWMVYSLIAKFKK